ncbi:MAG: hypothetical protein GY779_06565, partial [Gammaproteobacteria bacterium]|nr:hypothetical protein [Gammaproteobacteria bacterium]
MITKQGGNARPIFTKPSDTALTTVYTVGYDGVVDFLSCTISANAAANASVQIYDGSTNWDILAAQTMTAGQTILLEWWDGIPLRQNYVIKVQSSVGNAITFTAVISESSRAARRA